MRRTAFLPNLQHFIIEQLAQLNYATPAQLQRLCGVQQPTISKAVQELLGAGLIDGSHQTRPMILHLTMMGARFLSVSLPSGKRHASWSVMAHACHLTELQHMMAEKYTGFRFLSRSELLKQGLNPGFGEHGALDGEGRSWFVLLDDYLMTSDRITRSWTRRHTPSKKYWPDPTGRTFCDVAQRFLVVSTDEQHVERHRKWILKARLPAEVMQLLPIWKS